MRSKLAVDPHVLTGTWDLRRTIDDRVAGATGTVSGTTQIEIEDPDRLRWSESGVMDWQGRQVPITRVLHLVRRPSPDCVASATTRSGDWFVIFDDGRDFHPWVTGEQVEHPCGADVYRGRIDVDSAGRRWAVEWDVTGPTKDYTVSSVLTRPQPGSTTLSRRRGRSASASSGS